MPVGHLFWIRFGRRILTHASLLPIVERKAKHVPEGGKRSLGCVSLCRLEGKFVCLAGS